MFTASCSLQVLREARATLMTLAETFLHDPLVDWSKTGTQQVPGSRVAAGGVGALGENLQARDALTVMEGRLSGSLLGVRCSPSLPLSCEGQAARLLAEATDKEHLGRMYIWWMPWF